jgi:hypothetical protein
LPIKLFKPVVVMLGLQDVVHNDITKSVRKAGLTRKVTIGQPIGPDDLTSKLPFPALPPNCEVGDVGAAVFLPEGTKKGDAAMFLVEQLDEEGSVRGGFAMMAVATDEKPGEQRELPARPAKKPPLLSPPSRTVPTAFCCKPARCSPMASSWSTFEIRASTSRFAMRSRAL